MEDKLTQQLEDLLWGEATGEGVLRFLLDFLSFLEARDGVFYMDPALYDSKEDYARLADKFITHLGNGAGDTRQLREQVLDVITSVMLPQTYRDQEAANRLRVLQDWLTLQDMYARRDTAAFEAAMSRYFGGALESLADLTAHHAPASPDDGELKRLRAELQDARERVAELEADRARLRKRIETLSFYR